MSDPTMFMAPVYFAAPQHRLQTTGQTIHCMLPDVGPNSAILKEPKTIFLTGATGYIGGRLAPKLLDAGYSIRCLTRSAAKLNSRQWVSNKAVQIVEGSISEPEQFREALQGCTVAYYLVHSMEAAVDDYRTKDFALAERFGKECATAGVERIIYLGGLGEVGDGLSKHLSSRREVETALKAGGVPVIVLRAAMIIGSGSASFEILRYLVERLPVMVTPKWVKTESQPIAVTDVLYFLQTAIETAETTGRTLDIGGPDVLSYAELMDVMASALGLRKRLVIPVPVLTPRLSSLWIHLVTPLSASIARPLAEGLKNRVVCRDDLALRLMPRECRTVREAIDDSLDQIASDSVQTGWSDAGVLPGDPIWAGGTLFTDKRAAVTPASQHELWLSVISLGGKAGYGGLEWLWRLRGAIDKMFGGPGLSRGRRASKTLRVGDPLDFWRVTRIEEPHFLELTAEMKLPGSATLTFEIQPTKEQSGGCHLSMTARFHPKGLAGIAYWYLVLPLHGFVFKRLLHGLIKTAEQTHSKQLIP